MEHVGDGPARWSLAGTRPRALVLRLIGASLGVGVVGGVVTAWLAVLFESGAASTAAFRLVIAFPLVLVGLIGWRLGGPGGLSGWWLGGAAVAGLVLVGLVQAWPELDGVGSDLAHNAGVALLVAIYGAVLGVVPAVAVVGVLMAVLYAVRESGISFLSAQVLLTGTAMAVTGLFAAWITAVSVGPVVIGVAAALAGTGAVLTAPWCLVDRRV